jgi:uncharacterized membrane protein YgcG
LVDVPAPAIDGVSEVAQAPVPVVPPVAFVPHAHNAAVDGVLIAQVDPEPAPALVPKAPTPRAIKKLPTEALDGVSLSAPPALPTSVRVANRAPKPSVEVVLAGPTLDGMRVAPKKAKPAPVVPVTEPVQKVVRAAKPVETLDAIETMASFILAPEARHIIDPRAQQIVRPAPEALAPAKIVRESPITHESRTPVVQPIAQNEVSGEVIADVPDATITEKPVKGYFGGTVVLEKAGAKNIFGERVNLASIRAAMAAQTNSASKIDEDSAASTFSMDGIALSATRVAALFVIIVSGFVAMPVVKATTSYFTDTEASPNHLATGIFDLEVGGFTGTSTSLTCGDYMQFDTQVTSATGSMPIAYETRVEKTGGLDALCDSLELTAWIDGDEVYQDPILDFTYPLATTDNDWTFKVKLPLDTEGIPAGSMCAVDVVLTAVNEGQGYTDEEHIPIVITKIGSCGTDGPCDPSCEVCGDVTVIIDNTSSSTVTNTASSSANTGGNSANGGAGGAGGSGGNGGNGGAGGTIKTGNASSSVTIINSVNTNTTIVKTGCGNNCCNGSPCNSTSSAHTTVEQNIAGAHTPVGATTTTAASIKNQINAMIDAAFATAGVIKK